MVGKSPIEWTQETWNPIVGCSIVSPGCTNCYAMKMAARIEAMGNQPRYAGTTRKVNGKAIWTGKVAQAPEATLLAPLRRKKPTTYFVNSMSDLFHEDVPDEWIDLVLAAGAICPQHTLQILTKRAARMHAYMTTLDRKKIIAARVMDLSNKLARESGHAARIKLDHFSACFAGSGPFKNIWLGVSTERQQEADERIPLLLQTPAAVRFISAEPLLGPINLTRLGGVLDALAGHDFEAIGDIRDAGDLSKTQHPSGLDWVIVGGESGPDARPMHPDWARSLRVQCQAAGVPFFFKQWGNWIPGAQARHLSDADLAEYPVQDVVSAGRGNYCFKVGKSKAGRSLDGIEYNEMPGRG